MGLRIEWNETTGRWLSALVMGAFGASALLVGQANAAAVHIDCPVAEARREIVDPLPAEWWTTPLVNGLSETEIMNIGGQTALVCRYGSSGSVQSYAPEGMECSAVAGGFNCASGGVIAPPSTFSTDLIVLQQTYLADFDRNASSNDQADIWFQAETADLLYFVPRNGAKIAVGNRSNRGYDGCAAASFTPERVSLSDMPVGSYICMKTNEGRVSQFRVNDVTPGSPKTVTLGYTTWE